ncbi:hypothetical protein PTI98_008015 [Pleurotus ostreatus]|nr:hypothetical protein PTI98_008015 [Pleurotus ostreatus]
MYSVLLSVGGEYVLEILIGLGASGAPPEHPRNWSSGRVDLHLNGDYPNVETAISSTPARRTLFIVNQQSPPGVPPIFVCRQYISSIVA